VSALTAAVVPTTFARTCCIGLEPVLLRLKNLGNLCGIDRSGHVAVDDLQFSASGLVCDRGYLSLNDLATVKANPDPGAYAVVHILSILPSIDRVMVVAWEARELSTRLTCG
jgi:hypothetical protein